MSEQRSGSRDELVAHLAADLRPVKPLNVVRLSAIWLAVQLGLVFMVAMAMPRPDIVQAAERPLFQGEMLALLFGGFCAGLLAVRAAVPGWEPGKTTTVAVLALGAIAMSLFVLEGMMPATLSQFVAAGWRCSAATLALAALPCGILALILRGGAPIAPVRAGLLAAAGGLFFAAAALRSTCPGDEALHLLVWHGIPVAGGVAVAGLVATRVLGRWWQRP
ncbi:MAG TPA: NrsF family protein [Candidatus Limnocylindria bacterium]|nr:NrsF family protein [Candidatus Limnocylindria bacterium]